MVGVESGEGGSTGQRPDRANLGERHEDPLLQR